MICEQLRERKIHLVDTAIDATVNTPLELAVA